MSRLTEDIGGQLSPASKNEMTLSQKVVAAKAGERKFRRKYITATLELIEFDDSFPTGEPFDIRKISL